MAVQSDIKECRATLRIIKSSFRKKNIKINNFFYKRWSVVHDVSALSQASTCRIHFFFFFFLHFTSNHSQLQQHLNTAQTSLLKWMFFCLLYLQKIRKNCTSKCSAFLFDNKQQFWLYYFISAHKSILQLLFYQDAVCKPSWQSWPLREQRTRVSKCRKLSY